jgi:hypothetical protein
VAHLVQLEGTELTKIWSNLVIIAPQEDRLPVIARPLNGNDDGVHSVKLSDTIELTNTVFLCFLPVSLFEVFRWAGKFFRSLWLELPLIQDHFPGPACGWLMRPSTASFTSSAHCRTKFTFGTVFLSKFIRAENYVLCILEVPDHLCQLDF